MGGPAVVKAAIKGLDPSAFPGASARLGGTISLDAEVSADRPDLAALNGTITFPELDLAFGGLTLTQQQPSSIRSHPVGRRWSGSTSRAPLAW